MLLKNISSVLVPALLGFITSLALNSYTTLVTGNWPYSLVYFIIICFCFNLVYAFQAPKSSFVQVMLAGIVIKLLLALTLILVYSVKSKPGFFNFSIHFILHYILFTIFEIRYLLHLIKTNPIQ